MPTVGAKKLPYVGKKSLRITTYDDAPKPSTDEDINGCLFDSRSRWPKSITADFTKKFRGEDSKAHGGTYDFPQLKDATRNFHPDNKIGEVDFGQVYKGKLPNTGLEIAVKKPVSNSKEGKRMIKNELAILTGLDHQNVVKLLGCSWDDNQLLLVYEYMENNSLSNALFGGRNSDLKSKLNWKARLKICLGIAKGLAFLHDDSNLKIIHRNIKPTNILLDKDLNAKLSGFGLAKHHDEEYALGTKVRGTSCYVAPEYAMRGLLTYKSDVFNFGVVMLEILSGKASIDSSQNEETAYLLDRASVLEEKGELSYLMDSELKMDFEVKSEVERALNLAMLCTKQSPAFRPKMSEVVSILEGKTPLKTVPKYRVNVEYQESNLLRLKVPDLKMDREMGLEGRGLNLEILCTRTLPFVAPYSYYGFRKASVITKKSDTIHAASCSIYDITNDGNHHEKELLVGDNADIEEYDFEDAASTMLIHDHLSSMEEEEEEDNAGVPDEFEGGSSIPKVNNDESIGDQTTEGGQKENVKLLMERNFILPVMLGPSESSNAKKSWSSTSTQFTDHVMNEEDKWNLEYIEPTFDEDGKLRIGYSEEEFEEGCNEWKDSLVGFFVGDDKPVIMNTILNKENVETLWGVKGDDAVSVYSMENDYFLIHFKYAEDKIKVLESGPWHIENRPLILREWNWKLKFDKANEIKITLPIWVKMYNLPLFLWTSSYLSKVGSALGTPLYSDEKTKNKERLDFARLCIQVVASKSLPNSLNISIKDVDYEIKFEYEWKPLRCAKTEDTKQN